MYRSYLLFLLPLTTSLRLSGIWNNLEESVYNITDDLLTTYDENIPEDARLNIDELTRKYNYSFEEHRVLTEDGYILNLHRIPYGKDGKSNNLTVLLMHGILDSSDSWVLLGPDRALAYVLADAGFDVWMGNARGNKHSARHVTLNPDQNQFWEFTWEEIGLYDLPATINYIEKVANKTSLYYIGYSQGTTVFYVMASMRTEFNNKVKLMVSLAPEAWMGNIKSPIVRLFSPANSILGYLLPNFNVLTSSTDFFNKISSIVCSLIPMLCGNFLYGIFGSNDKINKTISPIIFGHMPSGSSTLQFVHYGQLVQSGGFSRFDFGLEGNLENYGTISPQIYNCSNIEVPVMIYYSDNDLLSDAKDVRILENKLPTVYDAVNVGDFNHLDYVYSEEAIVIYREIISRIEGFEDSAGKV